MSTNGSMEKQGAQGDERDMKLPKKMKGLKMEEVEECKTPTRSEIPDSLKCPPAPRKKRVEMGKSSAHDELNFFEDIIAEEIELFFKSIYDQLTRANKKCKTI
ncbi:hypothetical protein RIF29_27589 [Crotalaria pallida]|uniref:Uncharacterized protein n=1 Tax=Crotalaria pallida TaxID=3830 RepID=A0AAN9I2H5_CROPI